ncbi:hypothetical protein, partial [Rathayibacter iranicus]|uniref:hypothetical protein n=1 Tax=Rathayibacter iranicus TaxID=59737 RepID=UPI001F2308B2
MVDTMRLRGRPVNAVCWPYRGVELVADFHPSPAEAVLEPVQCAGGVTRGGDRDGFPGLKVVGLGGQALKVISLRGQTPKV